MTKQPDTIIKNPLFSDQSQMEEGKDNSKEYLPNLPTPLNNEEKKYLLAVERGDISTVRKMLQKSHRHPGYMNKNCVDPLGRGALLMAIDNECLEMLELLVVMSVDTKDALLHAIDKEFVEGVEVLLEHEEVVHKEGEPYSWEKVDRHTSAFTPDITPLILAAHRDNYEILKILLDRGAVLPMPHDIRCSCEECLTSSARDSLNHSMSRINSYKALASPSLIALSSKDPILTAFELSWELKNLANAENEFRVEYMNLRKQCKDFSEQLLGHTRTSNELAIILNHDPDSPPYQDGEHMRLARLELAIEYKQKKFVSHPNVQQLLGAIWYEGLPGFKRKPQFEKLFEIVKVALLFPFYCVYYMLFPYSDVAKYMRTPFMKFLIHSSSYLFFLLLLILHSVRFDQLVISALGSISMIQRLEDTSRQQRGNLPTPIEWVVVLYILGFILEEFREAMRSGLRKYFKNMWNIMDVLRDSLYMMCLALRLFAFAQQKTQISNNPQVAYLPREEWDAYDPQLISEGLFAAANILSGLKLVHIFSINPYLGPLQISLGRMVIDIIKFFFIYTLVLFAFACGLTQLLWYFNDLEKRKCYSLPGGIPDWNKQGESCMKWRRFHNVFEASQSLFWAGFGMVGLEDFELTGIREYTRFWSMLMFGTYCVINIIVLLNLLIAMMSNSYSFIAEHADSEWKFARTKLWLSYFYEGGTLPPPFNIFPSMKLCLRVTGNYGHDKSLRRMSTRTELRKRKAMDYRYLGVMRAIIWRYICSQQHKREERPITEDDVSEVKGDISSLRFELIDLFGTNGMDVSACAKKSKAALGRKMRVWERRLMRNFHVSPAMGKDNEPFAEEEPKDHSDASALDKFRRIAKLAIVTKMASSSDNITSGSQIGKTDFNDDTKRETLKEAMENARRRMQEGTPDGSPGSSRGCSPYPDLYTGPNLLDAIRNLDLTPRCSPNTNPHEENIINHNNLQLPGKNRKAPKKLKNQHSPKKSCEKKTSEQSLQSKQNVPQKNTMTTITTVSERQIHPQLERASSVERKVDCLVDFKDDSPVYNSKQLSDLVLKPFLSESKSAPQPEKRAAEPPLKPAPVVPPKKVNTKIRKLSKVFSTEGDSPSVKQQTISTGRDNPSKNVVARISSTFEKTHIPDFSKSSTNNPLADHSDTSPLVQTSSSSEHKTLVSYSLEEEMHESMPPSINIVPSTPALSKSPKISPNFQSEDELQPSVESKPFQANEIKQGAAIDYSDPPPAYTERQISVTEASAISPSTLPKAEVGMDNKVTTKKGWL